MARSVVLALKDIVDEQKVICFNDDAETDGAAGGKRRDASDTVDGIEVIRCGCAAKIDSQSVSFSYNRILRQTIESFKPDIVLLHYPNPFVTFFLLNQKRRDYKLLVYWHLNIYKQKMLKYLFVSQTIRLLRRADRILAATPMVVDNFYKKYMGDKIRIIPYIINGEQLRLSGDELRGSAAIREEMRDAMICFFIGRHVPYKGLETLIRSAELLKDKNIVFLIAGSGQLTDRLKKEAISDKNVVFLGQLSEKEKRMYMNTADVFCFPSVSPNEGFGIALAEAMYYGHPAVTYTIKGSGINYINLNGVTGIECPLRDHEAYADALVTLYENRELREKYGAAAKHRVETLLSKEKIRDELVALIEEL